VVLDHYSRRVLGFRLFLGHVYWLLKYGADYTCQKIDAYEAAYRERVIKGLVRKAAELGYRPEAASAAGS
jgi:hypothetical protein